MIDFSNARIDRLVTHYVGNSSHEEPVILSSDLSVFGEDERDILLEYFLAPLTEKEDMYQLAHDVALEENQIYKNSREFFSDDERLIGISRGLAEYLADKSTHPRIMSGYLNVVHFSDILVDDELVSALGLFKSETTSKFFKYNTRGDNFEIVMDEGYDFGDLDKAFLCINTLPDEGFLCLCHDARRSSEVAHFWKEEFLGLKPMSNAYFQTAELMKMTKSFVTEELPENFSVPRPDQIAMLNRSAEFFKHHDEYDRNEFVNNIFDDGEMQQSFESYQRKYEDAHESQIPEHFDLSQRAVQQQSRVFKSILKLDKNFHVYIHGDRNKIQFGRESDGRKFYKIYFDEEK